LNTRKLLVDAHTFDENHQGIRSFLKGVYSAINIDPNQLEIILVANDVDNLKQEFRHQKDFKYVKLNHTNKYIRLAYEIPKLIKKLDVDFAHFNYFLPLFLSKKCKYIVTIHDVLFIDFPEFFPKKYQIVNSILYKRSARKAEILTTVSEYSRDMIKKNFQTSDKPITILPNAASDLYWEARSKKEDKHHIKKRHNLDKYIIFVSRFEPRKNHMILLQAYQELELWTQGYSLVFVGKETFKSLDLEKKIKEVNTVSGGMVVRLEDVKNDHLVRFYNAAELSVFPSLCEGFGIPPIESAILKTPTLCSKATAMSDFGFFENYLFDATNVNDLKSKMRMALDSKNNEALERISNTIKARYSWKNTAKQLKELILKE
jgi:glycosyltransferase involved in cell wall biosynthesis